MMRSMDANGLMKTMFSSGKCLARAVKPLFLLSLMAVTGISLFVMEKYTSRSLSVNLVHRYNSYFNTRKTTLNETTSTTTDAFLYESGSKAQTPRPRSPQDVRVLVWIMTSPNNLQAKASVVRDTWGRRANKLLFFSSSTDHTFPTIGLQAKEGRNHLTAKTMLAFRYIYQHHFHDADWFMKADDDTYVIMENLRHFLSQHNTSEPVFFGYRFKTMVRQGYYSGGAGYVISKEALRRFGEKGSNPKLCRQDGKDEDVQFGRCMQYLGVRIANSTDSEGGTLFHPLPPEHHFFGTYPHWMYNYAFHKPQKGFKSISRRAISFHYITPEAMKMLELYFYHIRPYANDTDTRQQK